MTQLYYETISALVEKQDIVGLMEIAEYGTEKTLAAAAVDALGDAKADQAVGLLLFQAVAGKWAKVRRAAILALGKIGNPVAVKPLSMLLEKQDNPGEEGSSFVDKHAVLEALGAFASRGDTDAIRIVVKVFGSNLDTEALAVLKSAGERAVDYLIGLLEDENETTRVEAIQALGKIGNHKATGALVALLKETQIGDVGIAEEVVISLGRLKDPISVGSLIAILGSNVSNDDTHYKLKCLTITALGEIADKQATPTLVKMLRNSKVRIRARAAAALGKIGDNTAVDPLIKILGDDREGSWVREAAAWALWQMEDGKVALPLLAYLKKFHAGILEPGINFESDQAVPDESG